MISPTTGSIVFWPGGVERKGLVAAAAFESPEPGKAMCATCARAAAVAMGWPCALRFLSFSEGG